MPSALDEVTCASLPAQALGLVASLRCEPGLRVAFAQERAWLRWNSGNQRVTAAVLPIHGVELFAFQDGRWHRLGHALPAFDMPAQLEYQPLAHVLFPAGVQAIAAAETSWQPLRLTLQSDHRPRQTAALIATLEALLQWSDTVPTARLESLHAAVQGDMALIVGPHLPPLLDADRFWGRRLLIPLGFAPAPALPESALAEVVGMELDEIALVRHDRIELIARSMFAPFSRANLRQAAREAAP